MPWDLSVLSVCQSASLLGIISICLPVRQPRSYLALPHLCHCGGSQSGFSRFRPEVFGLWSLSNISPPRCYCPASLEGNFCLSQRIIRVVSQGENVSVFLD